MGLHRKVTKNIRIQKFSIPAVGSRAALNKNACNVWIYFVLLCEVWNRMYYSGMI